MKTFSDSHTGNIVIASGETVIAKNLNLKGSLRLEAGGTLRIEGFLNATDRVVLSGTISGDDIKKISCSRIINQTGGGTYNSSVSSRGDYVQGNPNAGRGPNFSYRQGGGKVQGQPSFSEKGVTLNGTFRPYVQNKRQTGFWVREEFYLGDYYENPFFVKKPNS